MKNTLRRLLLGTIAFLIATLAAMAPASATTALSEGGSFAETLNSSVSSLVPADLPVIDDGHYTDEAKQMMNSCDPRHRFGTSPQSASRGCLTLWRWKEASSDFHNDLPSGPENWVRYVPVNNAQSTMYQIGNFVWSLTITVSEWATSFDPLKAAGYEVDNALKTVGNTILGSPLLSGLVVILILSALFGQVRQRGSRGWKSVGKAILAIGLIGVMTWGASQSTSNNNLGTFSPAYLSSTLSNMISAAGGGIAEIVVLGDEASQEMSEISGADPGSCSRYIANMRQAYAANPRQEGSASVPLALDAQWRETGLASWRISQFGPNLSLSENSYCRLLDWQSDISGSEQYNALRFFDALPAGIPTVPNSDAVLAFEPKNYAVGSEFSGEDISKTTEQTSTSLVAWSACKWGSEGWTIDPKWASAFANTSQNKAPTAEDCKKWWTEEGKASFSNKGDGFAIKRGPDDIVSALPGDKDVQQYVAYMQGIGRSGAAITPLVFIVSSVVNLVVFGGLSIVAIGAKVAVLAFALVSFIVFLGALLPGRLGEGMIGNFGRQFLGYTLIAWGYQVLLALVLLLSSVLTAVVTPLSGGYGSFGSMLMSSVSPLLAVWALMKLFTNVLRLPNPMSPRGASGLMRSGGKIGGSLMKSVLGFTTLSAANKLDNKWDKQREDERDSRGPQVGSTGGGRTGNGGPTKAGMEENLPKEQPGSGKGEPSSPEPESKEPGRWDRTRSAAAEMGSGVWTQATEVASRGADAVGSGARKLDSFLTGTRVGQWMENQSSKVSDRLAAGKQEAIDNGTSVAEGHNLSGADDVDQRARFAGVGDEIRTNAKRYGRDGAVGAASAVGLGATKLLQATTGFKPGKWEQAGVVGKAGMVARAAVGTAAVGLSAAAFGGLPLAAGVAATAGAYKVLHRDQGTKVNQQVPRPEGPLPRTSTTLNEAIAANPELVASQDAGRTFHGGEDLESTQPSLFDTSDDTGYQPVLFEEHEPNAEAQPEHVSEIEPLAQLDTEPVQSSKTQLDATPASVDLDEITPEGVQVIDGAGPEPVVNAEEQLRAEQDQVLADLAERYYLRGHPQAVTSQQPSVEPQPLDLVSAAEDAKWEQDAFDRETDQGYTGQPPTWVDSTSLKNGRP